MTITNDPKKAGLPPILLDLLDPSKPPLRSPPTVTAAVYGRHLASRITVDNTPELRQKLAIPQAFVMTINGQKASDSQVLANDDYLTFGPFLGA